MLLPCFLVVFFCLGCSCYYSCFASDPSPMPRMYIHIHTTISMLPGPFLTWVSASWTSCWACSTLSITQLLVPGTLPDHGVYFCYSFSAFLWLGHTCLIALPTCRIHSSAEYHLIATEYNLNHGRIQSDSSRIHSWICRIHSNHSRIHSQQKSVIGAVYIPNKTFSFVCAWCCRGAKQSVFSAPNTF